MFSELYKNIGYKFQNEKLLEEAITHPSANEDFNYERLEFLGDSVLTFFVTEILMSKFKNESEGDLAKRRAAVINGKSLFEIAENIKIKTHLILSNSEERSGGRDNQKILENAMEAIVGALYLDAGIEETRSFIEKHWLPFIEKDITPPVDEKTYLQEWAQANGHSIPEYRISDKKGPDHNPHFTVVVKVGGFPECSGTGPSKKEAEKHAAANIIKHIKNQ